MLHRVTGCHCYKIVQLEQAKKPTIEDKIFTKILSFTKSFITGTENLTSTSNSHVKPLGFTTHGGPNREVVLAGTNQTNIIKALQLVTVYISYGNKAMFQ